MDNAVITQLELEFCRKLIAKSKWIFAKTMPQNPHYYMLRKDCTLDAEFVRFVEIIRKYGYRYKYGDYWYTQLDVDEWFYWSMGAPIEETILINRKDLKLKEVGEPINQSMIH